MKKYSVLWFDDEFKELNLIKESATLNDISLYGFDNAKDGIEELEKNVLRYDAVIVDGKFYNKPGQSGDAVDDSALLSVARAIDRLSDKRVMPWFILSGQPSFTKEKNRYADGYKNNKVYDKLKPEQLQLLWNDLKKEADLQPETQIKHDFSQIFEVCSEKYIGNSAADALLKILKKENSLIAFDDPNLYFNPLRKIVEDIFIAFNKYGILPDVFIRGSVALNESFRFLCGGTERGYSLDSPVLEKVVQENAKSVLSVCQTASHRSDIDLFISKVKSPYLLLSIVYQLLDVLLWIKIFIDENNNIDLNKARTKNVASEAIKGIIEQDTQGNFHCEDMILTYKHIREMGYKPGDKIRIIKVATNTNEKTMHLYPKSALQTEKL